MRKLWQDKAKYKNLSIPILGGYFFFIILLGVAYAHFNTTLQINGVVTLDGEQWPAGVLPSAPVTIDNGANISNGFKSQYLTGTSLTSNAMTRIGTVTENYDAATGTYRLDITKAGGGNTFVTENFNLNFTIENLSTLTWENGTVTSSYTAVNNSVLRNLNGTLDKTTLAPGESVNLNMTFTLDIYNKFKGTVYNEEITYKINFQVGQQTRTVTVILSLKGA